LFRVSTGSTVSRELEFDIRLLPQHYWEPLEVTKNSPIIVDESTTIAVTRQYLEVKIISIIKVTYYKQFNLSPPKGSGVTCKNISHKNIKDKQNPLK